MESNKKLYNQWVPTAESVVLNNEIKTSMNTIFEKWKGDGYNRRQILTVFGAAVLEWFKENPTLPHRI